MANAARLHFTLATARDTQEIFDLVYRHPDPFLKAATILDVEGWIANGTCWIVCDLAGPTVVGVCNIKVPETEPDSAPEPAEFGGIFLDPDFRVRGMADALATLALASYFWDNDPDDVNPIPLISHVHVDNDKPLRLIDDFGFKFVTEIEVPEGTEGFEHMPRDAERRLVGKEFLFPPERRVWLFRQMADLLSADEIAGFKAQVTPALGMDSEELRRLADVLEAKYSGP